VRGDSLQFVLTGEEEKRDKNFNSTKKKKVNKSEELKIKYEKRLTLHFDSFH